jgi:hypothetical protein
MRDSEKLSKTIQIVRKAMELTAPDVRTPKCVRKGLVKRKA